MLHVKIIPVGAEVYRNHMCSMCGCGGGGQNIECFSFEHGGTYSNRWAWGGESSDVYSEVRDYTLNHCSDWGVG